MIYRFLRRALDINLPVQWRLNRCAGKVGMFACRGRIQLSLCSDTIIKPGDVVCYIDLDSLVYNYFYMTISNIQWI